ncbi:glycosyltransferase [Myxococcota bacterium]|nr:glycosyltransferase [Myxococcota bacterium]
MSPKRRVLLCTWDGGGVVPPQLQVARELIARGHEVIVQADPTVESEARAAGCGFVPWNKAPHRRSRDRSADIMRDYAYTNKMKYFETEFRAYLIDPGPDWTADVLDAIDARGVDMVLCDFMVPWAALAAEKRGLPHAVLVTHPYPLPTPGVPPQGSAMVPVPAFLAPLRDAAFRRMTEWVYDKWKPVLNRVRSELDLTALPHAMDQLRRAGAVLVLTAPAFDYPGPTVPGNVHWVGPKLADPTWCEPLVWPWPEEDERPLVVVGMSSTFQDHADLMRRIVGALAELPLRGLVGLGLAIRADEVPGAANVVVVPSVPHGQVLPRASALVTHCGHGTTLKGLSHGLPMVCIPMGRDQDDNAARVAALGAGLRLKPAATQAQIRSAVESVLREPGYRKAARGIADRIARGEGQEDAAQVLEAVMATRGERAAS